MRSRRAAGPASLMKMVNAATVEMLWRLRRHYENCPSELPFNIRSTAPFVFFFRVPFRVVHIFFIKKNRLRRLLGLGPYPLFRKFGAPVRKVTLI